MLELDPHLFIRHLSGDTLGSLIDLRFIDDINGPRYSFSIFDKTEIGGPRDLLAQGLQPESDLYISDIGLLDIHRSTHLCNCRGGNKKQVTAWGHVG